MMVMVVSGRLTPSSRSAPRPRSIPGRARLHTWGFCSVLIEDPQGPNCLEEYELMDQVRFWPTPHESHFLVPGFRISLLPIVLVRLLTLTANSTQEPKLASKNVCGKDFIQAGFLVCWVLRPGSPRTSTTWRRTRLRSF